MNLYLSLVLSLFTFKGHTGKVDKGGNVIATATSNSSADDGIIKRVKGLATYYANKFEGRKTTSGERYRAAKFTAAHLKYPLGTVLTVRNVRNGKTVDVTVNDRGPHSKKFSIDLSKQAAKQLGFFGNGVASVEYFVKE